MKKIIVENFRGIEKKEINVKNYNIFMGPNGHGKSSFLDAIRFGFTGEISKQDVRLNTSHTSVTFIFDDGESFQRKYTLTEKGKNETCYINEKKVTGNVAIKYMENKIGCSLYTFNGLCGTDYLSSLSGKYLNDFLLSLMPVQMDDKKLIEFLETFKKIPLSEKEKEILFSLFTSFPVGMEEIDSAYKKAYEERRVLNRLYKEAKVKASAFSKDDLINLPSEEELRKEMHSILEEKGRAELMLEIKKKKETLEKLKKEYESYKEITMPKEEELTGYKKDRDAFNLAIRKRERMISTLDSNIKLFEKTLKNLDRPVCPISDKLICTTDKTGLRTDLENMIHKNQNDLKEHKKFITRCQEQIQKRDKMIDDYSARMISWNKKVNLENEIKNLQIPQMEKVDSIRSIEEINKKISLIEQQQKIWVSYYMAKKAEKEMLDLEEKIKVMNFFVRALNGDGIKALIMQKTFNLLTKQANQIAEQIQPGFAIQFGNGTSLAAKFHDGPFVSVEKLSSGEMVLTIFLVMCLINAITGAKTLIIDSLDRLDNESLKSFLSVLMKSKLYDNVFLGMVDHEDSVKTVKDLDVQILKL